MKAKVTIEFSGQDPITLHLDNAHLAQERPVHAYYPPGADQATQLLPDPNTQVSLTGTMHNPEAAFVLANAMHWPGMLRRR